MRIITDVSREKLLKEINEHKGPYGPIIRIITKDDRDILCSVINTSEESSLVIRLLKKDVTAINYKGIESIQVLNAEDTLQIVADLVESRDEAVAALVGIQIKSEGISKLTEKALKKLR